MTLNPSLTLPSPCLNPFLTLPYSSLNMTPPYIQVTKIVPPLKKYSKRSFGPRVMLVRCVHTKVSRSLLPSYSLGAPQVNPLYPYIPLLTNSLRKCIHTLANPLSTEGLPDNLHLDHCPYIVSIHTTHTFLLNYYQSDLLSCLYHLYTL